MVHIFIRGLSDTPCPACMAGFANGDDASRGHEPRETGSFPLGRAVLQVRLTRFCSGIYVMPTNLCLANRLETWQRRTSASEHLHENGETQPFQNLGTLLFAPSQSKTKHESIKSPECTHLHCVTEKTHCSSQRRKIRRWHWSVL